MNTSHRLFTVNKVLVASVPWIVLVVTGVAAQEKRDEFYYLSEMCRCGEGRRPKVRRLSDC